MAGTLRNLLVRIGADVSGLRKGLQQAQKDVAFFGRNVTGSLKEIQGNVAAVGTAVASGFILSGAVQDAMRYEALMTTLGESMGQSRKDFEKWQQQVGASMGYSKLQAAETANILSLNFKKIATDQADLVGKTTKMMEVAAVVANKRGMTMQEVSDRIRSAMNQEADGADELGVNVRVAAIQTSQAYQQMANGQPWDQLNEKMRQTILYHHILEQVSSNLGTTIQDTTAMRMAVFTAALSDVRLALGQAFLPIMYTVLPILTMLARALERVLQFIGAFMASLFGGGFKFKSPVSKADVGVAKDQAAALGGVGDAAEKAGKKSEKAGKKSAKAGKKAAEAWKGLFGFDEVHTIDEPKGDADKGAGAGAAGGAGGGGGGLDAGGGLALGTGGMDALEGAMDALAGKMDKYTKPIREAFKAMWKEISGFFKKQLGLFSEWWKEHGDTVTKAFKIASKIVLGIVRTLGEYIWNSVKLIVEGVLRAFRGIITFFSGVFTGDWQAAWDGLQDIFVGALQALIGFWNLSFIGGLRKILFEFATAGAKRLLSFANEFKGIFNKGLTDVRGYWSKLLSGVKQVASEMKAFIDGKVELMQTSFKKLWDRVTSLAQGAVRGLKSAWGGVYSWFLHNIVNPVASSFERIKDAFSRGIGHGFKEVINQAIGGFNNALAGFNRLKNATPFAGSIPDLRVPYLAKGGIATRATLAMVGEGSQSEAIAPLDRLQAFITNAVTAAMGRTGGGVGGDIILNIDGRRLARIVKPLLDAENKRVGANVKLNPI